MGKRFPEQVKGRWVKKALAADRKADAYASFAFAYAKRFKNANDHGFKQAKHRAIMVLRSWLKHYNRHVIGLMENKNASARRGRKRKIKLDPSKLDPRDVGLFIEILEDVLNRKGITNEDIAESTRRIKEKPRDKKALSSAVGVDRKVFYRRITGRKTWRPSHDLFLAVERIRIESRNVYGRDKIHRTSVNLGYSFSIWSIRRHLDHYSLRSARMLRKRRKPRELKNTLVTRSDLVQRRFDRGSPMEVACTDVTFIPMRNGKFCYLSLVIDGHSNKVLGHAIGLNNDADLVLASLNSAALKHGTMKIIHSDNGVQYLSEKVADFCAKNKSAQSFSRPGNSLDNRPAEFFFAQLKQECIIKPVDSVEEAIAKINDYIEWYNTYRIQLQLGGVSPDQFLLRSF